MKTPTAGLVSILIALASSITGQGQEIKPMPANSGSDCGRGPRCCAQCYGPTGLHWTLCCFPRCGCPDDYCPNPYPRQCWPPYPPFYKCVPAGDCGHPPCVGVGNEKLTWWWIPTPQALRDALWCKP
jgi:hypothetical protein